VLTGGDRDLQRIVALDCEEIVGTQAERENRRRTSCAPLKLNDAALVQVLERLAPEMLHQSADKRPD
jgi:hypothetical protein